MATRRWLAAAALFAEGGGELLKTYIGMPEG
jgi:hypothetical protein